MRAKKSWSHDVVSILQISRNLTDIPQQSYCPKLVVITSRERSYGALRKCFALQMISKCQGSLNIVIFSSRLYCSSFVTRDLADLAELDFQSDDVSITYPISLKWVSFSRYTCVSNLLALGLREVKM